MASFLASTMHSNSTVQSRVLLLRHERSDIAVDISLGMLPFEQEVVDRAQSHPTGHVQVPLPTVEDLLIMKAVAYRPKDLQDIATLVRLYPDLDDKRVKRWVKAFAEILEMPEMWEDLAPLLKQP